MSMNNGVYVIKMKNNEYAVCMLTNFYPEDYLSYDEMEIDISKACKFYTKDYNKALVEANTLDGSYKTEHGVLVL